MAYRLGLVCALGVGPERGGRADNEDNYLVCDGGRVRFLDGDHERVEPGDGAGLLLAVCDGMGGHADGRLASLTAARVLAKLYQPGVPADPASALSGYVREAHASLHRRVREAGRGNMGTTLTACWIVGERAAWAHVGDSRLYLQRGGALRQLTADHTRNEFARRDGLPPLEPDFLCQGFIFGSRGLGDDAAIRVEPGLDWGAEVLAAGDRLLLCTDGLTSAVDDATIGRIVASHDAPQDAADALLAASVAYGSTDNVTAIVVYA